jgi:hypothetical protein
VLTVDAGHAGRYVPGRAVPLRVTVAADRLLAGELVARTSNGDRAVRLAVEVPGGSRKRYAMTLPAQPGGGRLSVTVTLRDSGKTLETATDPVETADGQELAGLLPGVVRDLPLPGSAAVAADSGQARFVALEAADLTRGSAFVESLSAIGLTGEDLAGLAPSARTGLLDWVAAGGRLLVDTPPGEGVETLPAAWRPGAGAIRAAAGRGEVRHTAGAMTAGRWAGLIEPSPLGQSTNGNWFPGTNVAEVVARDAGFHLPRLATLLVFLAVYVLVAGPVTALVLRRRGRPELAWVVVPALALVFTLVAYGAGGRTRNNERIAHGTLVDLSGPRPVASTWIGLTRGGAGTARVGFPVGWSVSRPDGGFNFDGGRPATSAAEVALTPDGPVVEVPLAVGQFGIVDARGPARLPGQGLQVTAAAGADGQVTGEVRNRLPWAVDEVVVFAGNGAAEVGRIETGETKNFEVRPDVEVRMGGGRWFETFFGDQGRQDGVTGPDGVVNLPVWQTIRAGLGAEGTAPGTVTVVGWTRDYRPDVQLDGERRQPEGRTALLTRAAVTSAGPPPAPMAVSREVVRGFWPSSFGCCSASPDQAATLRFVLPPATDAASGFTLTANASLQSAEYWSGGTWRPLFGAVFDQFGGGVRRIKPGAGGGVVIVPQPQPVPFPPRPAPPGKGFVDPGLGQFIDASDGVALPADAAADGVVFVRILFGEVFSSDPIVTLGRAS